MARNEVIAHEDRIHLIKSVHRLCELRRAKRSRQIAAATLGGVVRARKCKRCGEEFHVHIPRENRRLYCDECIIEHRREVGRKKQKRYAAKKKGARR